MVRPITPLSELIEHLGRLRSFSDRSILGITGPPGSGKSALAKQLAEALNAEKGQAGTVAVLPMDGFHLANEVLEARHMVDRKGAPETFDVESYVDLLTDIRSDPSHTWSAPDYSRELHAPVADAITIDPTVRLVITEGNYLLLGVGEWARVKQLCSEVWFLDVEDDVIKQRLVERQLAKGKTDQEALDWVERNDMAHADLVRAYSVAASRYLRVA